MSTSMEYLATKRVKLPCQLPFVLHSRRTLTFVFVLFSVDEARMWLERLVNDGGCNLLKALKHVYTLNGLHTACIIIGSLYVYYGSTEGELFLLVAGCFRALLPS